MKRRDISIDLLKGVGILLVVIGHLCASLKTNFVESFHMPLFFLVAGYFYRKEEYMDMLKKSARRYMLPYTIAYLIIIMWYVVTEKIFTPQFILTGFLSCLLCFPAPTTFHGIGLWPVLALWFLTALFLSKNIYNFLYHVLPNKVLLGLCCFVLAGCGILVYKCCSPVPFCVCQALEVLPYLFIGNLYRESSSSFMAQGSKWYLLPMLLLWFIAIFWSHERISDCEYACYPLDFAASLCATYIVYIICGKAVTKDNLFVRYISWLGRNSLAILCIHDLEWQMNLYRRYIGNSSVLHVMFVIALSSVLIFAYDSLCELLPIKHK